MEIRREMVVEIRRGIVGGGNKKDSGWWRQEGRDWAVGIRREIQGCGDKRGGTGLWREEGRYWVVEIRKEIVGCGDQKGDSGLWR